jgi:hypothetical protein
LDGGATTPPGPLVGTVTGPELAPQELKIRTIAINKLRAIAILSFIISSSPPLGYFSADRDERIERI